MFNAIRLKETGINKPMDASPLSSERSMIQKGVAGVLLVLLLLGGAPAAWAHKVYVFAWVEKGMVHTESSFGDQPVHGGAIDVVDMAGQSILTGKTDDQGHFSFPIPQEVSSDLTVKLNATMGHQAQWKIALKELTAKGEEADQLVEQAMEKKAVVEAKPSMVAILAGIAVIFLLALGSAFIQKRIKKRG